MAEWKCARCSAQNAPDASSCYFCGAERDPATVAASPAAGSPHEAVGWSPGDGPMPSGGSALAFGPGGLAGGLVAGLLAAVVATIGWYLVVTLSGYQVGFVAVAVGWLIGTTVVFGARGRVSWPLVGAAVAITLVSLAVSEYLILYHLVSEMIRVEGLGEIELFQPLEVMVDVVISSITEDPVTLVFWAVALLVAGAIPFRELRPAQPEPVPAH